MDDHARNRQWRLASRPTGAVGAEHFELVTDDVPEPGDGQALVRVTHLSMDPTIRGWMSHDTYLPRIKEGAVIRSLGLGEVVASDTEQYPVGALVSGVTGWQDYVVVDEQRRFDVVPAGTDPLDAVSLFGPTGLAAYFGMLDVGQPADGDTVLVSGAAGATGSVAGQVARLQGAATVIGTAGTDDKCATVVDDYGFDACINYRTESISARLRELAPDGIDVFFDNVGGDVLEAALSNLALHARIALCGAISMYDGAAPRGPRNYSNLVSKRSRMQGFLIFDHADRYPEAMADLGRWAAEGSITHHVDVVEGFEQVPAAFQRLFTGDKQGKNVVRII